MPDKKLTDAEIVKALECCDGSFDRCGECPLDNINQDKLRCWELEKYALDLINRQKAENERLYGDIMTYKLRWARATLKLDTAKAEAYKEFAKKTTQTLAMFNAQELAGVSQEYNNRYFYENPKAWTEGSITARNEAIAIVNNFLKKFVGE